MRATRPVWRWSSRPAATSVIDLDNRRNDDYSQGCGAGMREPHHPTCEELELPAVLHALSDPARLQIVRKLAEGDECTCGTFELGLSKATLSHHFRVLRECGVVRTRPDGRKRMLSLRDEDLNNRFPGLLSAVLSSAKSDRSIEALL
jgi:DNA-binding transcriptional ArsR family regulator